MTAVKLYLDDYKALVGKHKAGPSEDYGSLAGMCKGRLIGNHKSLIGRHEGRPLEDYRRDSRALVEVQEVRPFTEYRHKHETVVGGLPSSHLTEKYKQDCKALVGVKEVCAFNT